MQPQYSGQSGSGFAPLTPMRDRGRSDAGSSEYSPVSGAEPEPQEVKTEAQAEVLHMARFTQALAGRQSTT